jgi:hypothetical protein
MTPDFKTAMSLVPSNEVQYSKELCRRREDLLKEMETCKNRGSLAIKLRLLSKAFKLFADQTRYEKINKVRMMAICERDRIRRRLGRKTLDDCDMDSIRPVRALSRERS